MFKTLPRMLAHFAFNMFSVTSGRIVSARGSWFSGKFGLRESFCFDASLSPFAFNMFMNRSPWLHCATQRYFARSTQLPGESSRPEACGSVANFRLRLLSHACSILIFLIVFIPRFDQYILGASRSTCSLQLPGESSGRRPVVQRQIEAPSP